MNWRRIIKKAFDEVWGLASSARVNFFSQIFVLVFFPCSCYQETPQFICFSFLWVAIFLFILFKQTPLQ